MKLIIQILLFILVASVFARVEKKATKVGIRARKAKATARYSRGEERTQMAFNGGSWGDDAKIYLKEVDGPTSDPDVRGIVFSSNFGKNNFQSFTYNNANYNLQVYYLPYRNLNKITCQASGSNRAITSDGTTSYDIWLNVYEAECNTIANYMDANRRARQATLAKAAKDFSTYGTDYVTNIVTYEGLLSGSTTIAAQITSLNTALATTNADITRYTKLSLDTGKTIASEEKTLSGLQTKSSEFQIIKDSNEIQTTQINASIDSLRAQGTSTATTKATYQSNAAAALTNFQLYLEALKIEAPSDVTVLTAALASLQALNSDDCKTKINSVIPQ
jgi:hypothetical protein